MLFALIAAPMEDSVKQVVDLGLAHVVSPIPAAERDVALPVIDKYAALVNKMR